MDTEGFAKRVKEVWESLSETACLEAQTFVT